MEALSPSLEARAPSDSAIDFFMLYRGQYNEQLVDNIDQQVWVVID